MSDKTNQLDSAERPLWELYFLIAGVVALTTLVTLGNLPRMSTWLLTLLVVGLGQAFLFPVNVSFLGGIIVVVLWITLRQVTGIWTPEEMSQNLLELFGVSLNMFLAIRFRDIWGKQQVELRELRDLKELMVAKDAGAGLLPLEIAELRLLEEIGRAKQFKRPVGLMSVEIANQAGVAPLEFQQIFVAVARQIISASLVHDIPFQQSSTKIGLILPERTWDELYVDVDTIANSLSKTTYFDQTERPRPIHDFVTLHFGLGTYQGEDTTNKIDLFQAANDSLEISRELANISPGPISAFAMPAVPIDNLGATPHHPETVVPLLGEILIQKGVLLSEELQEALTQQKKGKEKGQNQLLGSIMIHLDLIEQNNLDQALAEQIRLLQSKVKILVE